jgi:REP element-mobilizing transposase RayT
VESIRKWNWNYSAPGFYFITICTKDKRLYFGRVEKEAMKVSEIGALADTFWKEIPSHHKDVELDEFIVMPNHVHGIIRICGPEPDLKLLSRAKKPLLSPPRGSLGVIARSYKAAVTHWCKEKSVPFGWQPRYHDRIIRSPKALAAVRQYIRDNPKNWLNDEHYLPDIIDKEKI